MQHETFGKFIEILSVWSFKDAFLKLICGWFFSAISMGHCTWILWCWLHHKPVPHCLQMLWTQSYVLFFLFRGWVFFFYRSIIIDNYFFFAVWATFSQFAVSVLTWIFDRSLCFSGENETTLLSSSFVRNVYWK